MNDFTKSQLYAIDYLIDCHCSYSQHPEGVYAILKEKIQSMIEQYCEHEFRTSNEAHFKCLNCGIRET